MRTDSVEVVDEIGIMNVGYADPVAGRIQFAQPPDPGQPRLGEDGDRPRPGRRDRVLALGIAEVDGGQLVQDRGEPAELLGDRHPSSLTGPPPTPVSMNAPGLLSGASPERTLMGA